MDGQNQKKGKYEAVEMEDREGKTSGNDREEAASLQIDVHDNIEEPFDEEFWEKVRILKYLNSYCNLIACRQSRKTCFECCVIAKIEQNLIRCVVYRSSIFSTCVVFV